MKREQAVQELLRVITDKRDASCRRERERAAAEARDILRAAHAEARKRLRPAVEEAARRPRDRLARAEAQRRTRERLARQQRVKARLEKAWRLVRESLERSWLHPGERRGWVERAASRAAEVLPAGSWNVSHPAAWPPEEREGLRQWLLARGVGAAGFSPDPAASAGLRFASGTTVLDATLEGFLADRPAVEARLLFHLGNAQP
jgi:hypothetical protein